MFRLEVLAHQSNNQKTNMSNPNPPTSGLDKNPQNINRNGRPKREWTMAGLIEEALEECDETGQPYKKVIARKLRELASKGDIVAIKEVNNRLDGMPQQDLTSKGEKITTNTIIFTDFKNETES